MKRFFKWIGLLVAALVILLLAAAVILPLVFDPNDHKDRIEQQASEALGRIVRLEGPIGWSVFPWLAIELNDVTIANESGFQAALLMRAEQASARIRVMPLLRGEFEIGTIGLQAPMVNLEVAANGRNNWDSIGGEGEGGEIDDKLVIAGIQVDNGRLDYSDRATGIEASLSSLNLSTGAIQAGSPMEADLDFELSVPQTSLQGRIRSRVVVRDVLSGGPASAVIEKLEMDSKLDQIPLLISLNEPAELDGAADTLSASKVMIRSAGATVETSLTARDISGDMALSGHVRVAEFDFAKWLEQVYGSAPERSDDRTLSVVTVEADYSSQGDRAELENLLVRLDDSQLSGKLTLSSLEKWRGNFALRIDQIDLDRYLAPEQAASADSDEDLLANLDFGNLKGTVVIDKLTVSGMHATDVTVTVSSGAQGLDLDPINAQFYGGRLESTVLVRPNAQRQVQFRQDLSGVQAGPLLEDLLGRKVLTGLGNLNADITLDRPTAGNPLASANGTISYDFNDGQLFGIDVFGTARRALVLLGKAEKADESEDTDQEPATDFSSMVLKAQITDGILDTNRLELRSPLLEMNGRVKINLADGSLRGTLEPALLAAGAESQGLDLGRLAGVSLPVSLSGTMDAPEIGLDPAKLLLASQRAKLDDGKGKLLDRLGLAGGSSDDGGAEETSQGPGDNDAAQEETTAQDERQESGGKRAARSLLDSLLQDSDEDDEETKKDDDSR